MTEPGNTPGIDEIREKLRGLADCPEKVDLLNELSVQLRDSDTKQALESATSARALAESIGYQTGLAYGLRNLATCLYLLSDFAAALDHGFEALQLFHHGSFRTSYRTIYPRVWKNMGSHGSV